MKNSVQELLALVDLLQNLSELIITLMVSVMISAACLSPLRVPIPIPAHVVEADHSLPSTSWAI